MHPSCYHQTMKYYFVEPVCYGFFDTPIIGIPTLIGILEQQNHEAKYIGLNNELLEYCLDEKRFKELYNKRAKITKANLDSAPSTIKHLANILPSACQKNKDFKYNTSRNKLACRIFENKDFFLNEFLYEFANKTFFELVKQIGTADNLLMHLLLPNIVTYRSSCQDEAILLDVDALKYYFENKLSPLDDYLEEKANEIISENPDCVGISIGYAFYFITGMLLAYKIKKKSNIHVNIGGSFFDLYRGMITNLSDLFGEFFDSISINNNTKTVTDILRYINKEIEISDISNIIYKIDNKVTASNSKDYVEMQQLPFQSFTGYNLEKHLTPSIVLPIQSSNSCYWGRCKFCVCSGKSGFQTKPVINVYEELEYLSKKYQAKHFAFWDNSMHPSFVSKLADIIIERKLKINFSIYARLEKEFDYELLKKLKKAGCLKIHWGLDSANQRILDYVDKGIDLKTSERILKDSKKAGIYNFVYIITGFPTETKQEMEDIHTYLKRNHKNINNVYINPEMLFSTNSIFSQSRNENRAKIQTTLTEREEYKNYIKKQFPLISSRDFSSIQTTQLMLLYVEKYGNGYKTIQNKKFVSFMRSHPKLLSIYLKQKLKQVAKNK